jgi:hypothetical protein
MRFGLAARTMAVRALAIWLVGLIAGLSFLTGSAYGGFGFKSFEYAVAEQPPPDSPPGTLGPPDTRAGSHPWQLSVSFALNTTIASGGEPVPEESLEDLEIDLPAGFAVDPQVTPRCSMAQFTTAVPNRGALPLGTSYEYSGASCPNYSQVGMVALKLTATSGESSYIGLYNLLVPAGQPPELGFNYEGMPVVFVLAPRSDGSYAATLVAHEVSESLRLFGMTVTLRGVPGEAAHDAQRGECLGHEGQTIVLMGGCESESQPMPFLTLPTSCPAFLPELSIHADSWQSPGSLVSESAPNEDFTQKPVGIIECEQLEFDPSLTVDSQTHTANASTGLEVELGLSHDEEPFGVAASQIKEAEVVLPAGLAINIAALSGLEGCALEQIQLSSQSVPTCPPTSTIGSVQAMTPVGELSGAVYLAQPRTNPLDDPLAVYVALEGEGAWVKLVGKVQADPTSGQLSVSFVGNPPFEGLPQLPISDLDLSLFGGPHAPLRTLGCGPYTTSVQLTPWSGTTPVSPRITALEISGECGGGFVPAFATSVPNTQASGFSSFAMSVSRDEHDQPLGRFSVRLAPGLLGMISRVTPCAGAVVEAGGCTQASQVGHVSLVAGAGPDPISLPQAGDPEDPVYLTGPYGNAPFGLAIVLHLQAGPLDLGTVLVRAGIYVDHLTTQLTIVTDPLPSIVGGIPLDLRTLTISLDRPEFMFNPSNCKPEEVTGTIISSTGASAVVSSPLQATGCSGLPFAPAIFASTSGKTSRVDGASLYVKIVDPHGEAVAGKVKIDLPKQLPARLATLNKACTNAVFEANPAACPSASRVATALTSLPMLANPLSGPAYLVSHGGAKFPELVIVLQGEGIRMDLHGETFISPAGITSSTFDSIPDVPVNYFEIILPEGPDSALAANGSLCNEKLRMPNAFVGENGAVIHRTTPIQVTGCPQVHKHTAHARKRRRRHRRHRDGRP